MELQRLGSRGEDRTLDTDFNRIVPYRLATLERIIRSENNLRCALVYGLVSPLSDGLRLSMVPLAARQDVRILTVIACSPRLEIVLRTNRNSDQYGIRTRAIHLDRVAHYRYANWPWGRFYGTGKPYYMGAGFRIELNQ